MGGMSCTSAYAQLSPTAASGAPHPEGGMATVLPPATSAAGPHPVPVTPQSAPKIPDTTPNIAPSPNLSPVGKGDREILPALKGLVLIDNISELKKSGVSGSGIMPENLPMLDSPTIRERLAAYIGKPVSQKTLAEINQTIILWYRDNKYPFVDVAVPAGQDVTNGVVQIVVSETRSGKITARGNKWFSSEFLTSQVRLKPGDRINIEKLEEDKNWINQNPFRLVNIVANRSETPGVTDLVVDTVQEKFPARFYAGYSNSGQQALGHDRWNLGFIWGNALWLDDQLSYQFTTSNDFWHSREKFAGKMDRPAFVGHTISYEIATGWRDKITIYGSYLESSPLLGPLLGVAGTDGAAGIRYSTKLPSTRKFDEFLRFGFEFKTSNNSIEFGGMPLPGADITTEVDQFFLEYDATLRDDYGQTDFTNSLVYSPGGITAQNRTSFFRAQTNSPTTVADYMYDHVVLTRVTGLPQGEELAKSLGWFGGTTMITKFVGQISDGNLLPSEQIGAGGADSVRGYDERVANGSEGILFSEEIRSPGFSLAKLVADSDSAWNDLTQLGVFWDYGSIFDNVTLAGAPNSIELESTGMGLHVLAGPDANFRLDLDYGWQLRTLPGLTHRSQFGHLAITLAY